MAENEFDEVDIGDPEEELEEEAEEAQSPNPEPEQVEIPSTEPVPEPDRSFIRKVEAVPLGVMRAIDHELSQPHWFKAAEDFKNNVINPFEKNTLKMLYWMSAKYDRVFGKPGGNPPAAEN